MSVFDESKAFRVLNPEYRSEHRPKASSPEVPPEADLHLTIIQVIIHGYYRLSSVIIGYYYFNIG